MNIKRKLKKELHAMNIPSSERVLPIQATCEASKKEHHTARRPLGVMLSAAVLAIALIVGAVAAIPEIVNYLNARQITDLPYGLTSVPEGFVGIYDLDDLDLLRAPAHSETDFILMNDIDIPETAYEAGGRYESGFSPLGNYAGGFRGSLNGNGHVIRNVKLNAPETANTEEKSDIAVGLFGLTLAKITYLGVEDVEITVSGTPTATNLYVGALAAKAGVVGGCYAENVLIRYDATSMVEETAAIGGLVGYANYLDACFVKNADLTVADSGIGKTMLCGGIAGTAHSVVTSYFAGTLTVNAEQYATCIQDDVAAMPYPAYTPILLTEDAMRIIKVRLEPAMDAFDYKQFLSNYVRQDLDAVGENERRREILESYFEYLSKTDAAIYTEDVSEVRVWYQLTSDVSLDELERLTQLITEAFGSAEEFKTFCLFNGIKCGKLACYSFDSNESVTADTLKGFDLEHIWCETHDGITLRAFEK